MASIGRCGLTGPFPTFPEDRSHIRSHSKPRKQPLVHQTENRKNAHLHRPRDSWPASQVRRELIADWVRLFCLLVHPSIPPFAIPAGREDEAARSVPARARLCPRDRPKISHACVGLGLHGVMREGRAWVVRPWDRRGCRSLGYSGRLNFISSPFCLCGSPTGQPSCTKPFYVLSGPPGHLEVVRLHEYTEVIFV